MDDFQISAGGYRFDAVACGPEDGRLVILLHGFPQSSREWLPVMNTLAAAGNRPIAFDQRGYSPGARPAEVGSYAMRELVADVMAVADALGADRFDLVGHDWGAAVAWQTACRNEHRVKTLTTISVPHPLAFAAAVRDDDDQRRRSAYMVFFQEQGKAEQALSGDDWAGLRTIMKPVVPEEAIEHYVKRMSQDGALVAALNWYRAVSPEDLEGIGAATMPTLHIWGDQDPAFGRYGAELTAQYVDAPYRFEPLDGVGHWIPDERPEQLALLIVEHLDAN